MLLVDGNNIVAARRPWHPESWNWQRRLVMDVARLTQHWEACADVVFDGAPHLGVGPIEAGVRVWFSRRRTADDVIVELARELAPGDGIVATSDRALGRRVRACGARVVPSETLREALDRAGAAAHARRATSSSLREPLLAGPDALLAMAALRVRDRDGSFSGVGKRQTGPVSPGQPSNGSRAPCPAPMASDPRPQARVCPARWSPMKLNHIDLQVPDVVEAARFFVRWFGFVLESNPKSPAIAILRGADDFVLVLQRAKEGEAYPDGFHIGFLVPHEETVTDFHRRARDAGLEISEVLRNGRGVLTYCRGPGRILIEVSHPRARGEAQSA